mgnify:CR=1 FL=1
MPVDAQTEMLLSLLRTELSNRPRAMVLTTGVLGFIAAIIVGLQPAATADLPVIFAFMHWMLHICGAAAIVVLAISALRRLGLQLRWSIPIAILIMPLCLAPFSLGVEFMIASLTRKPAYQPDGFVEELSKVTVPAVGLMALAILVLFKGTTLLLGQQARLLERFAAEPNLRTAFRDLPPDLGDDLLSVSAHDHYVIVRTTEGSAMLSARFAETVGTLSRFQGTQVHRSHWVRTKHVTRIVPHASSYLCILSDGSEIPVSRRRYRELKISIAAKK